MSLINDVKQAQIQAGEDIVTKHLRDKGLIPPEIFDKVKDTNLQQEIQSYPNRISEMIKEGKLPKEAGLPEEEKLKVLKELGNRFNQGKLEWHLVDFKALEPMVKVLMYGKKKYAEDQWKNGLSLKDTRDSMIRHIVALAAGEEIDIESGEKHIGHLLCNVLFYSYFTEVNSTNARP